jgi:hypothetical protein
MFSLHTLKFMNGVKPKNGLSFATKVSISGDFCYANSLVPCWVGPLSPQHGASSGCGWREVLRLRSVTANILNKQSRRADKGWSSSLGVGRGANNPSA